MVGRKITPIKKPKKKNPLRKRLEAHIDYLYKKAFEAEEKGYGTRWRVVWENQTKIAEAYYLEVEHLVQSFPELSTYAEQTQARYSEEAFSRRISMLR